MIAVSQHDLPLVTIEAVVASGSADDPVGGEGLAHHAGELMRRGAGARDREAFDEALDQLGAHLEVHVASDAAHFGLHCLSRTLEPALALLADVLRRPRLEEEEHEKLRREALAVLDDIRDDDATLATRYFDRYALTGHPYGRTGHGTAASLAALDLGDVKRWAAERPARLLLGVAGDLDAGRAAELLGKALGVVPEPSIVAMPDPPAPTPGRRTYLVDKPERTQSQIVLGHAAPRQAAPDWMPLHVAETIFGGTFTSRLMTEVRVKRGWSYGAGCRLVRARAGHTFRIRVFPAADQTADTLALVLRLWEELALDGVTDDEVAFAKSYLEGNWAFEIDTPRKRLDCQLDTILLGLPSDLYPRYVERLRAVTTDEVNQAIRRYLHPEAATIVVTCTAETMAPRLSGLPLGELQVVAYDAY